MIGDQDRKQDRKQSREAGGDAALRLTGVTRSFGATEAIACLDLCISRHEFVAVIGPSGCGKTTLLNLLSGFDHPTAGDVERQGQVRMIYQQGGLFPWLTVAENIALGLRGVKDSARREQIQREMLALIHLEG